jgi:type IV pilus assembly protein PilO
MPRNFKLAQIKDPRVLMRLIIGTLLVANLVAAVLAFKPFGGSADDLRREQSALRRQLADLQTRVATTKKLVAKVESARQQGDDFLVRYISDRRTTFSALVAELNRAASDSGVKPRDTSIQLDPVEGSDTLVMMSISAGYEGNYANLAKFINLLDRSPRFLIIESMVATPQQGGQTVTVSLKVDTFVKDNPGDLS